LRTGQLAD